MCSFAIFFPHEIQLYLVDHHHAYAPLLLDTPVVKSHQSTLPPPGAQLPSSPSISDLEVQCFGDTQVLCSEISSFRRDSNEH